MTQAVSSIGRAAVAAWLLAGAATFAARAQDVTTWGELRVTAPVTLSRAELQALLPGASMSRTNDKGSTHRWTNAPDGKMVVSSDNRGRSGRQSSATGTWSIDEEGRYCMSVQWRQGESEESCRFLLAAGGVYWAASSLKSDAQKVYRLTISR
jgi:hypothetical protein